MSPSIRFRPEIWALIGVAPTCAQARMYQWVSPATSTPQLSGEPPPWYRGIQGGTRVLVYENGNLVDDTAIALPTSQREELRSAAFREAEERQRAQVLKRLEQAALREERRRAALERVAETRQRQEREAPVQRTGDVGTSAEVESGTLLPDSEALDGDAVARLKAIISEYDRRGGNSAAR